MLGAITGDIIGSVYEVQNLRTNFPMKSEKFKLYSENCSYTDDTVMTCAIANACVKYATSKNLEKFKENCINEMRYLGQTHINAGYGGGFIRWLLSENPKPYGSYGNGSAMRVSPVAYVSDSLEECEILAKISASVTHNHPEGIKGAQAVAGSIWLLIHGKSKEDIRKYVEKYYDMNFNLDNIREDYRFDVTCQGSVPESIEAFLEGKDFIDCLRKSISMGGDADTMAAITGSLAEAYYGIPKKIMKKSESYLDNQLKNSTKNFYDIVFFNKTKLFTTENFSVHHHK